MCVKRQSFGESSVKSIKLVSSMENNGCAISCLAMVARTSFFAMREKLSTVIFRHMDKTMNLESLAMPADEVYHVLRTHLGIRCEGVKFVHPMKNHCILFMSPVNLARSAHAVVWDAKRRTLLDPDGTLDNLDDFNVHHCLEILPPQLGLERDPRYPDFWRFDGIGPGVKLADGKIEYIPSELLLTKQDMASTTRRQRMARITKALGMTESEIKAELRATAFKT